MRIKATATIVAATMLAAAGVAAGASQASAKPASATCQPAWHLVPLPQADTAGIEAPQFIAGVPSVIAKDDVWAGASYYGPFRSWLLHWNGKSASPAPQVPVIPGTDQGQYTSLTSFDSSSDGWAVGQYIATDGLGFDYAARWHGGRWTITPLAVPRDAKTTGIQVHGVASLAPDSAWGVGAVYQGGPGVVMGIDPIGALIEHWDGTQWSIVPNPAADQDGAVLTSISARSASDIWAVGRQVDQAGDVMPLVEHWNGTQWTLVSAPAGNQRSGLFSISADAAGDAWAVGAQTLPGTANAAGVLVEHWDGSRWSVVPGLPDLGNTYLGSVYAASPSNVWATTYQSGPGASEFVHWDGKTWSVSQAPGPQASGLAYFYGGYGESGGVSGNGSDVWASGWVFNYGAGAGMPQLAHLTCGKEGS